MMKRKLISTSLISLIIFSGGCTKEKPPVGNYIGVLKYENTASVADKTVWLKIEESENDYILVGTTDFIGNLTSAYLDTLFKKDNKKIEGKLPSNGNSTIQLNGEWSHKFLSKKYMIKGTFTETYYYNGGSSPYPISGTFEIKSN